MCKNPLKRKVASQFLNILAQFLIHYQHFCKKKKKKSDAAPKSEEGGDEKQLCFFMRSKMKIIYFEPIFFLPYQYKYIIMRYFIFLENSIMQTTL